MKRCDPNARAKCPDGESCELYAEFADGSWCDDFNKKVLKRPMTNADRIRAISDEELCDLLMLVPEVPCEKIGYPNCSCKCKECVMNWLQQPAEEV